MGHLKISQEINLGSKELNKMLSFLTEEGYEKFFDNQTLEFGIIRNKRLDPNFNYFKVSYPGIGNLINIEEGYAICKVGDKIRAIYCKAQSITIPTLNESYWLKIAPQYNLLEKGSISINSDGSIIGVDTEFTSLLRGQPHLPSKIRLIGSSFNQQEYEVLEVISDTAIILAGSSFVSETNLQYEIIGTFADGYSVDNDNKGVFVYDGCIEFTNSGDMGIVRETLTPNVGEVIYPNLAPFEINEAFFIYKIVSNGTNIVKIEDHRDHLCMSIDAGEAFHIDQTPNPILGINKVSWDSLLHPKHTNIVEIAWGLTGTTTGPLPLTPNTLLFSAGNIYGGRIKKNSISPNIGDILGINDLIGWRLYVKHTFNQYDSNHIKQPYYNIIASSATSSNISVTLDRLSIFDFENSLFNSSNTYFIKDRVFTGLDNYISFKDNNDIDPGLAVTYNITTNYSASNIIKTDEGYVWQALTNTIAEAPFIEAENNRVLSFEKQIYSLNTLVFYNNFIYRVIVAETNIDSIPDGAPTEFLAIWELCWKRENQEIYIVPDCEEIEIIASLGIDVEHDVLIQNLDSANFNSKRTFKTSQQKIFTFNIANQNGVCDLLAFNDNLVAGGWNLKYRYKNNRTYSDILIPYSDPIGYLKESRINDDYQNNSNYVSYITSKELGWLRLIRNINSYTNVVNRVDLGDNLGVRVRQFDNSLTNYLGLQVGIDEYWQVFEGNTFSLLNDFVFDLPTDARDGNKFYLQFKQTILKDTFKIKIQQGTDPLNPNSSGVPLYELTSADIISFKSNNGFLIVVNYDKETSLWKVWSQPSSDELGVIEIYSGTSDSIGKLVCDGRTIGNSSSSATIKDDNLVYLFIHLFNTYSNIVCPVLPSRGTSAIEDWNAGKTIKLLDLRSRFIVGYDSSKPTNPQALTYPVDKLIKNYGALGNVGGLDSASMTIAEMPAHSHGAKYTSSSPGPITMFLQSIFSSFTGGSVYGGSSDPNGPITIEGGGEAQEKRPSYIVLNHRIKY